MSDDEQIEFRCGHAITPAEWEKIRKRLPNGDGQPPTHYVVRCDGTPHYQQTVDDYLLNHTLSIRTAADGKITVAFKPGEYVLAAYLRPGGYFWFADDAEVTPVSGVMARDLVVVDLEDGSKKTICKNSVLNPLTSPDSRSGNTPTVSGSPSSYVYDRSGNVYRLEDVTLASRKAESK